VTPEERKLADEMLAELNLFKVAPSRDSLIAAVRLKDQIVYGTSLRKLLHQGKIEARLNPDGPDDDDQIELRAVEAPPAEARP